MRCRDSLFRLLICAISVAAGNSVLAQKDLSDTSIRIDLLRAPSSPASTLLGMSPSEIEKPTDINAFMFSLRSATNAFTALPSNYAVEIAPFQMFNKTRPLDSKTLVDNKENFRRSFVVSLGIKQVDKNDSISGSAAKTQFAAGIRFAIKRGAIDDVSKQVFENIWNLQQQLNDRYADIQKEIVFRDPVYKMISDSIIAVEQRRNQLTDQEFITLMRPLFDLRQNRNQEITDLIRFGKIDTTDIKALFYATAIDSLRKAIAVAAKNLKLERTGFNLDFAAGSVFDFLDSRFNQSSMFRIGSWLTGGWNMPEKNSSALFIVRYLYSPQTALINPELNPDDFHSIDLGGRMVFTALQKKLLLSGEGIYRTILNDAVAKSSWRLMMNAEYEIGVNQKITFSFGRNFDGGTYKGGNVVGAINLLFGMGNQKINSSINNP
jgi:hypothetical protein